MDLFEYARNNSMEKETPLASRITGYFLEEIAGPGAVRETLKKHLPADRQ